MREYAKLVDLLGRPAEGEVPQPGDVVSVRDGLPRLGDEDATDLLTSGRRTITVTDVQVREDGRLEILGYCPPRAIAGVTNADGTPVEFYDPWLAVACVGMYDIRERAGEVTPS